MKLSCVIAMLALQLSAGILWATPPAAPGQESTGRLSIYNFHEDEYLDIVYKEGGKYRPEALKEISRLMRSRGDGTERPVDPRLIELIDQIQHHFGAETVELISGYRSPSYNRSLSLGGRGVASESLHMRAQAADIHLDEIREEELFNYAKKLGVGGAGIYPRFAFVHVDVGPPRTWQEGRAQSRVLVGTQNNPNSSWSMLTDKDIYARGEALSSKITNGDYRKGRLVKNVWIERFRRGKWSDQTRLEEKPSVVSLEPNEATEYGWRIPDEQPFGKYRLVIFTSKDFSIPPVYSNEFYIKH
ncbi:MAG: DUF882 domain-containing protein [Pseudomonadota bacterium]